MRLSQLNGDAAVRELSIKFDNYAPENFKLSEKEISDLIASLSDRELSDIKFAQEQVRNFAQAQRDSMLDIEIETIPGVILGHKNFYELHRILFGLMYPMIAHHLKNRIPCRDTDIIFHVCLAASSFSSFAVNLSNCSVK